jgi:hypothetical protein
LRWCGHRSPVTSSSFIVIALLTIAWHRGWAGGYFLLLPRQHGSSSQATCSTGAVPGRASGPAARRPERLAALQVGRHVGRVGRPAWHAGWHHGAPCWGAGRWWGV